MKDSDIKRFKKILLEEKGKILNNIKKIKEDVKTNHTDLSDEMDWASSELSQAMSVRFHDRDRLLLQKIEKALQRIEDGTFGICEECEEEIELKRLFARPVATLCISCKENQEKKERTFTQKVAAGNANEFSE